MHAELRRCNSIGDTNGILHFSAVILSDTPIKRESARQICSFVNDMRLNFNAALAFYEYLDLIESSTATLICTTNLGLSLKSMSQQDFQIEMCKLCLRKVVDKGFLPSKVIKFSIEQGCYYIQKNGFPFAAAVFRNFLIQLKAFKEQSDGSLLIDAQYERAFSDVQKRHRRKMSLDELKEKLDKQEEQGALAEQYVLQFEKKRLVQSWQKSKVRQISEIDVSAGYDIVSFMDEKSISYDRYIEVKSFKGKTHFYWSQNEMEVSKLYGDNYIIYLVDIDQISNANYKPVLIFNPSENLVSSGDWIIQPSSYLVLKIGEDDMDNRRGS